MPKSSRVWVASAVGLAALLSGGDLALAAAQPVLITPGAWTPKGIVLYELPYAISGRSGTNLPVVTETVVSIGNPPAASSVPCYVQVQWLDWDGTTAGVSGPFPLKPDWNLEFTTAIGPGSPSPYILNVFRNNEKPFEGSAKIRSSCETPLRIDAEAVEYRPDSNSVQIDPIKVTRPSGTTGD